MKNTLPVVRVDGQKVSEAHGKIVIQNTPGMDTQICLTIEAGDGFTEAQLTTQQAAALAQRLKKMAK